jgi:MscS family membrane protein
VKQLQAFGQIVLDVWQTGVWGIDLGRIIVAVFILIGLLLLRRLFSRFVVARLKKLARRSKTHFDDEAIAVLERPIGFIPIVMGIFFAIEYLAFSGIVEDIAQKLVRSLIALVLFWGFFNLVSPLSHGLRRLEAVLTASMVEWLIKAVKVGMVFLGAATILDIWGIQIGPIIAGLGLFGVAVALGAQDLFKNLISGISIIAEKRFNLGDWIRVDGVVEGTVESIGFRSTLVRRFDKAPVYVPNAKLSDNSVINFSLMTYRRIYWVVGVEYRTTVAQLRRIRDGIEAHISQSQDFVLPPQAPVFVRIDSFSDSSIDILVYCFTRTVVWGEWLEVKENLACAIKQIVEAAGAAFAFPSQSLYIETLPSESAEVFVAPAQEQPGERDNPSKPKDIRP